jgi:hypothetical protein
MSLQSEQSDQVASTLSAIEEKESTSKTLEESAATTEENNLSSNVTATNNPANLVKMHKAQSYSSSNGPTVNLFPAASASVSTLQVQQSLNSAISNKPILTRQERATSSYLASPQLSTLGTSEDTTSDDDNVKAVAYQLMPNAARCRTCHHLNDRRRSSISPSSVIYLPRSSSKESLCRLNSSTTVLRPSSIPPVFITTSSLSSSRVIRQSSQPEATLSCCTHAQQQQTSSLRQLTSRDASDPIAGIATETLRVSHNSPS